MRGSWKAEGRRANERISSVMSQKRSSYQRNVDLLPGPALRGPTLSPPCGERAGRGAPISFFNSSFVSHFDLAVGAGNPDLFRARGAGGFPIHGPAHNVPHLGEPPVGAGAPVPRCGMTAPVQL